MKYLIAGLGNIGTEYVRTRHNIGFDVADAFARKHGAAFAPGRLAETASCRLRGRQLLLVKPTTFMNLSGKAVRYWMGKEKIPPEQLLVVTDDLALPLEVLRLRPGGSDAGHNGLKSIQEEIGTNRFPRLRFGIGNQYPKGRQVEFVLGRWQDAEWPGVEQKIAASVEVIETFLFSGVEVAMNRYNHLKFNGPA